jgi:hypothetical protein
VEAKLPGKGTTVGRRRGQSSIHCAGASPLKTVGRADGLADGRAWPDCGLSSQISAVLCMGYHTKTSRRIETRRQNGSVEATRIAPRVGRASSCERSRRQVGGSRQRLKKLGHPTSLHLPQRCPTRLRRLRRSFPTFGCSCRWWR